MILIWNLAAFLAYFVKGLSGFANTLVFTSILSFFTANRNITPIDLLLGMPSNAFIAWQERRHIRARIVLPLIITLILGMLPGTFVLKHGDERTIKVLLGVAILILGINMLVQNRPGTVRREPNCVVLLCLGILSGFLSGLFGIGAFLVAYINRTTSNTAELKGNLCCVFLAENLVRLVLYLALGLMTGEVLWQTLLLIPGMALGLAAGLLLCRKIPEKWIGHGVRILLLIMGFTIIISNL